MAEWEGVLNSLPILDATCGSRMMWFDKENPYVIFADKRAEKHTLCDGRALEIAPETMADFKNLPFADGTFKLVVFDPPHLVKLGQNSWLAKKYGALFPGWEVEIKAGFEECLRVLDTHGVLIFKWNETQIPIKHVVNVLGQKPLFGHPTGRNGKTIWCTFMKMPSV